MGPLFSQVLKKYVWVLYVPPILISCALIAICVNNIIEASLAPYEVPEFVFVQPEPEEIAEIGPAPLDELLGVDEPIVVVERPDEPPEDIPPSDTVETSDDCQSHLPFRLVGTLSNDNGDWAHGVVRDISAGQTRVLGYGSRVGDAVIVSVERRRIWIENEDGASCLEAGRDPVDPPVVAAAVPEQAPNATPVTPVMPTPAESIAAATTIERLGRSHYRLSRDEVGAAIRNPSRLAGQAPNYEQVFDNGMPAGIQLSDITRGSLLHRLGIRNGDVLSAVNGDRLTTAQRMPELVEHLERDSEVIVEVIRRGRVETLRYEITG